MSTDDAIVIGEEWISEHYFTTDATKESFKARVLARRKEWDDCKTDGTPRSRFTAARTSLLDRFATLDGGGDDPDPGIRELNQTLRDVLGFQAVGLTHKTSGPVTFVHSAGLADAAGLAIVDARPAKSIETLLAKDTDNLVEPFHLDEPAKPGEGITSVARLLSTLFVHDDFKPAFALVLAGQHVLIAERERWPEGRYLALDLQLVCERNDAKVGGEIDRALTCLAAESLAPNAEGDIWWSAVLQESVKHTVGVSKDLREGVRLSIEIIANEVVRRRQACGLDPLPAAEAQPLAKQSLRFLYRILFLLYAEASPELGVLPTGAAEYDRGYSLDRLRELTLVELATARAQGGTHLYESLAVLFRLVDQGHLPPHETTGDFAEGLTFRSLRADLFKPAATALIDEVGLGNAALQEVLKHLLLSKEARGKDRGFISYAQLGINQLGAVYEGLMSYTGFFAETDLYEVAKDGNAEKGSWVVPVERAEGIAGKDFVTVTDPTTGEVQPVLHQRGTFVFRLAGRERQQSASYYTPEVLTRFVVSQALEELLDQDGHTTSASEILRLTICEPALGSGAFAIEAVRQLAEQYLTRRQAELGRSIDPDAYPRELQKVKAYLALHQTYGVDLNATAVELAEISLWLDTMVEGLEAPWFGLHLRRGNSLIGARNAMFTRAQVSDRSWLTAVPAPLISAPAEAAVIGGIHHFLVPADGWGTASNVAKDIKDLVPSAVNALKDWRKTTKVKPTKKQVDRLLEMSERVQQLWEIATRRLKIADQQVRRDIPLWGRAQATSGTTCEAGRPVPREEIEASLADPDGAYRRLRRVMDAWCALWFWPLTEDAVKPPTLEQWYDALGMLLGGNTISPKAAKRGGATLDSILTWDDLGDAEYNDRVFAGASPVADVLAKHPWLQVCARIADQQGFFHWELDFAPIFAAGGFALQTGNPPWVQPSPDVDALLAEGDPWWQLKLNATQAEERARRVATLALPGIRTLVVEEVGDIAATTAFVGAVQYYPMLGGAQIDLYRSFIELAWRMRGPGGTIGLVHYDTHMTERGAGHFRAMNYRRLRRHWHFKNELKLFEIGHQKDFGVSVFSHPKEEPDFLNASMLYHPDTLTRSLVHDGSGDEPGIKDLDDNWDQRPHAGRIGRVVGETLLLWQRILGVEGDPPLHTPMIYVVAGSTFRSLSKVARAPRLARHPMYSSNGWSENTDRQRGYFEVGWGQVDSWDVAILQGPFLFVATPFYQSRNATMKNKQDWSSIDLEKLPSAALPVTSYKVATSMSEYRAAYGAWQNGELSPLDFYRVAWRRAAANAGERTLIPAIIPPGAAHVHYISSLAVPNDARRLALVAGVLSSLVSDFQIRMLNKDDIYLSAIEQLADVGADLEDQIILRALRLNCVTDAYAGLWGSISGIADIQADWTGGIDFPGRGPLDSVSGSWSRDVPLRRASDRRQALVEIDALVALGIGLDVDELCALYRAQFPVLSKYDRKTYYFDAEGRLVPNEVLAVWRKKGHGITEEERTATNASGKTYVYEMPFRTLDREAGMRAAYANFEKRVAEWGS